MIPYNLTEMEVHIMMRHPWTDELSPVFLKQVDSSVYNEIPLLRQMLRLLSILEESGGVKLTSAGYLPPAIVRELYSLGVPEWAVESYYKNLNSESKTFSVMLVRAVLRHLGLIRKYKGMLLITKSGQKMSGNPEKLLPVLMDALCTDFDMGFYDGYEGLDSLTCCSAMMYVILSKYGDIYRTKEFLKNEYLPFVPLGMERFDDKYGAHAEFNKLASCLHCRIIERHMVQLGLVEVNPWRFYDHPVTEIRKTPIFDKLIGFRPSCGIHYPASNEIFS